MHHTRVIPSLPHTTPPVCLAPPHTPSFPPSLLQEVIEDEIADEIGVCVGGGETG